MVSKYLLGRKSYLLGQTHRQPVLKSIIINMLPNIENFDLIFYAYIPNEKELTKFIINLEPQDEFYPGYPLVKRGFYYDARLISGQYGTEFTGQEYGKIKKVISIWI